MKIIFNIIMAFAAVLLMAGCETESSEQISIMITPNNITLQKGESREFIASGWQDYTWTLSEPTYGVLSTTKGDRTTYTAVKNPTDADATLLQILTLMVNIASSSTPSASSPASTNVISETLQNVVTAQALITHTYTP